MILITGCLQVRPESMDEVLTSAIAHVHRSRGEPGCIAHAVHYDVEDPQRLVFVERWTDLAAVRAHFAVPESGAFVALVGKFLTAPPTLEIFEAQTVSLAG